MLDKDRTGIIFNMQKFSVHDGEGIRTLVFLKGCPLRCQWCSNPESQNPKPEKAFNPMRCITAEVCGRCAKACPHGAIRVENGMLLNDRSRCVNCLECTRACPSGAQTLYGEEKSVDAILNQVERDGAFYARSGGGLTLSGGEALMQPEFACGLLREAHARRLNTALETCGCYAYEHLEEAARHLDGLMYDIKCFDAEKHKKFTGVDNELILRNFTRLCRDFPDLPITARTPVIPGFNDSEEDILAIFNFLPKQANVRYELLPYHRMGQPKYEYLGRRYELEGVKLDEIKMERLKSLVGIPSRFTAEPKPL
ncbi:MAG: glycyl-radical enzyme activating protein [Desulfovibrionaceae bacterium]|nr:glycyl-radical enzyme activating protein [Desulfovibrionaceae bacterium]